MASIIICPKCGSRETVSGDAFSAAARCSNCGRSFADSRDMASTSGSFSGHRTIVDEGEEPLLDWDRGWRRMGTFLAVLAIGSFILPLFGLQFRFLQWLGPAQYLLAIVAGIFGAVLIAIGLRKHPLLATLAACSVVMLMVVSGVIALLASAEWDPEVAQPPQQHRFAPQQPSPQPQNVEQPSEPEHVVVRQMPDVPDEPAKTRDEPVPELAQQTPVEPIRSTPPSIVPPPLEAIESAGEREPKVAAVGSGTSTLDEPGFELPALNYHDDELFSTGVSGSDRGEHSGERAPEGGVIVGFRIV